MLSKTPDTSVSYNRPSETVLCNLTKIYLRKQTSDYFLRTFVEQKYLADFKIKKKICDSIKFVNWNCVFTPIIPDRNSLRWLKFVWSFDVLEKLNSRNSIKKKSGPMLYVFIKNHGLGKDFVRTKVFTNLTINVSDRNICL